jgi:hypothetical protein
MSRRLLLLFTSLCLFPIAWSPAILFAQNVSGSISGSVVDSSATVIAGASLRLVSESTGAVRAMNSDSSGAFVFNAVLPGAYTLQVEHAGFKKYEKKGLTLTASEALPVGEIRLELGSVSESVTVQAEGAMVQTASGERSGVITSSEVENLTVISRDFSVLITLQPGVVLEPGAEVQGFGGNSTFYALGGRNTNNNITLDGVSTENTNSSNTNVFISMDAVQTVKVMVSNFQAEFGRKPGAGVQAITKSGTRQFHGLAYYYKRHEMFNANDFFNNRTGVAQTPYRYTTAGYNLGGPIYIPGVFNRNRDKLFFFFSQEFLRESRPQTIQQVTSPTLAERRGDFSDSRDTNGALIQIRDPLNNKLAFPGNFIPASRINPSVQNYLNLLPVPNALDPTITRRTYNYQFQESLRIPKHTEILRVDYSIDPKTMLYARFNTWDEDVRGNNVPSPNTKWGWLPNTKHYWNKSLMTSASRILTPSLIVEGSWGFQRMYSISWPIDDDALAARQRKNTGWSIPQLYPQYNEFDLLPMTSFSGRTGALSVAYDKGFPMHDYETAFNASTTVTKTTGPHVSKAGFFWEHWNALKRK